MRIATISALVSVTFASTFFAACSSSDSGGGNTGGKTTVGGAGGAVVGGAGGTSGGAGGAGATTSGGAGGAGGGVSTGSCKGACGSEDGQGNPACYCDSKCAGNKDCCSDYVAECTVKMPTTCVKPGTLTTLCNPVTNEGCSGNGVACDLAEGNVFSCFNPPNDVPPGGACDLSKGPYCVPKYKCQDKICKQYCCTNADCTGGGTCKPMSDQVGTLGACEAGGTDGGTDGGSDASTDATTDATPADATPPDAAGDATTDAAGD